MAVPRPWMIVMVISSGGLDLYKAEINQFHHPIEGVNFKVAWLDIAMQDLWVLAV
jgi:hypothetical protein